MFDAPIPGMSLTHELGARPWQSPPQYPTVDDAIEYYLERMSVDEFINQLEDVLEMGVPVTTLANTIQLAGVMDGKHSVDVGMLVMPMLMEMIMLVGDGANIKYDDGLDEIEDKRTKDTIIQEVRKRMKQTLNEPEDTSEEKQEEPKAGLMARRK